MLLDINIDLMGNDIGKIITNDNEMIKIVKSIYPYCRVQTSVKEYRNRAIKVFKCKKSYQVNYKHYFYDNLSENGLLYCLYELFQKIFEEVMLSNSLNVLHGSCVEKDSNAYVFAAKTNTGKSTLIYELNYHGYNYVSDDYAILDKKNFSLHPLHLPIKLRSLDPVCKQAKENIIVRDYNPVRSENYYLLKPFSYCENKNYTLKGIFIITRNDKFNQIKRLDYKESYKNIILNAKFPDIEAVKRINIISLSLIKNIHVYDIQYTNTVNCRDMIDSVIGN